MGMVQRYQKRISGPLMDRIDIHLDVARVPFQKLDTLEGRESSDMIRARVEAACVIQQERFCQIERENVLVNGDMGQVKFSNFVKLMRTVKVSCVQLLNRWI